MASEITFTIEGEKELSRRLLKLGEDVKDFKPEFTESSDFLKGFFGGEVFDTRGGAIGKPWVKRKRPQPWPLLERSGKMRRSFQSKGEKVQARVWNAVDYFKFHQSILPRHRLPRRVMMKLTDTLKDKIIAIFHKGLWERTNR